MASRLARSAIAGASVVRPSIRALRPITAAAISQQRFASNVPQEDPKQKAQSLVDSLPGNSLLSKTAILSAAGGLSIYGISNEFLVINEEFVTAFCLLSVFYAVFKYGGPAYKEWADGQIAKMNKILNSAREDHTSSVKARIESVQQMGSVVDVTKQLFAVSKETAQLEAQAFELEQKTALAHEAKTVLDSWIRYESQLKQREQQELAQSVISKVQKELENPKVLQQILTQSIADVEKIVASKAQ